MHFSFFFFFFSSLSVVFTMGSGSSTQKKTTRSQAPACPVFYNYSPSAQHIPASTLPTRDSHGNVRRPQGGCAARLIALRNLPVVTPEAKKEAKEFLVHVAKMRKAKRGDEAALTKIAEEEEQAKAVLRDRSLTPATSSCFLVNIAVDEQGRLAPLSTDGPAGLTDAVNAADNTVDSDTVSECVSTAMGTQVHPAMRKGFNFETASSNNHSNQAASTNGGGPPPSAHVGARKPPKLNSIPHPPSLNGSHSTNLALLPSPKSGRTTPPPTFNVVAVQRLSQQGAADAGPAPPAPLVGAKAMPVATVFAPPAATVSDDDGDETDSSTFMSSSTRSLLIRDSRFRRNDDSAPSAIAGDPTIKRMRRKNSRIKLMQVPNRTRWFLFNDSSTHEAQVTMLFSYRKQGDAGKAGAAVGSPTNAAKDDTPTPGEMKLMCVPTPLSRKVTAPKEIKRQLANSSSSSRSFVEVKPLPVSAFVAALPTPAAGPQKDQLAKFEANADKMAAVSLFVVLAPGVTVFVAEGETTGYMVSTHMVPFNHSTSIAVLGRLLTPDMVLSAKKKSDALVKGCYHYKLVFLPSLHEPSPTGGNPTGAGNGIPLILPDVKTAPAFENYATPAEQRGNGGEDGAPRSSSNNASLGGQRVSLNHNLIGPLPPIKAAKSSLLSTANTTEPITSSSEAAGEKWRLQQRLSRRSPSPTDADAKTERAGEQNSSQSHRKRIGSLIRNPSLVASRSLKDDSEESQSFHRDTPSCNSLAISF